ncbi:hypothetical protein Patl1_22486 [Pistacia atlantica]|uniref:Uncharacterized protein n=1 Tax=Pistacia atlantica TaxID=434234 RepID=A0ACC1A1U1_9ROSI|nr:hypothetical protein Patl1_22486 [Pistacia atlantica]
MLMDLEERGGKLLSSRSLIITTALLRLAAREGFALLEEHIRPPKKFGNGHQPPQAHDFCPLSHPQHYNKYQAVDHQPAYHQAVDHRPSYYQAVDHRPAYYNNNQYEHHQAAQLYGGMVIVDHSKRKQIPDGGY